MGFRDSPPDAPSLLPVFLLPVLSSAASPAPAVPFPAVKSSGDSVSVLFEKEVYEADLSGGNYTIQEEGSPFALINNAVKASTGKELSSEAYRQVSYVNDISFSNEQVLMERAVRRRQEDIRRLAEHAVPEGLPAGSCFTCLRPFRPCSGCRFFFSS